MLITAHVTMVFLFDFVESVRIKIADSEVEKAAKINDILFTPKVLVTVSGLTLNNSSVRINPVKNFAKIYIVKELIMGLVSVKVIHPFNAKILTFNNLIICG